MKNAYLVIILLLLIMSCSTKKISGTYHSTCQLYGQSDLVLVLYPNGKFQYHIPFMDSAVAGLWEVKGKSIVLSSESFTKKDTTMFPPKVKYTDNPDKDVYRIKGSKLYIVNPDGIRKACYLKKVATR